MTDDECEPVTVRQLVALLRKMNPNAIVRVEVSDDFYDHNVRSNQVYEVTRGKNKYVIIHGD